MSTPERTPAHLQMMATGERQAVTISAEHGVGQSPGEVRVQRWDKKDRTARSARAWVVCWVAAIGAIFIPVLHFFLVPTLLLAGPVSAFFIAGQENVILGGEGTCPVCHAFLPLTRNALQFPISDICPACQAPLRIEAV